MRLFYCQSIMRYQIMPFSKITHTTLPVISALLLLVMFAAPQPTAAQTNTVPADFDVTQVVGGLNEPTAMAFAPDGRLFVAEQGGDLRVIKDGVLLPTPFLSVTVDSAKERGLIGVAVDPDFASNGYVYIYHTLTTTPRRNRISRFTAAGDVAAPGSAVVIMELDDLNDRPIHNGGALHFGIDGKLYAAVGDNAEPDNAQTLANRHGKILRINADGSIPTDNPFYDEATGANRSIWALGLRNPFTFAINPLTGALYINDVGQKAYEEINEGLAGANYGWALTEGYHSDPRFENPLYVYPNGRDGSPGTGCAIAGGAFYAPEVYQFPFFYAGAYFFGDYCSGWIRRYVPADGSVHDFLSNADGRIVDLRVERTGALYYLSRQGTTGGAVYRISYTPDLPDTRPQLNAFDTDTPTLTWNAVTWATEYQIQVATNPEFIDPVYSVVVDAATLSVTTDSLTGEVFYWRARARRADGSWGNWSSFDRFVIAP